MQKTLLTAEFDTFYNIIEIQESPFTTKLINLGMAPGASVKVIRKAPFGQVYYVKGENSTVALRLDEMAYILIA